MTEIQKPEHQNLAMNLEEEPLPDLHEGVFDAARLMEYFSDINNLTTVHDHRIKGPPGTYAHDAVPPLDEAMQMLLEGQVHALQLFYTYQNSAWSDTLMPQGELVWKLVRMQC